MSSAPYGQAIVRLAVGGRQIRAAVFNSARHVPPPG